MHKQKKILLVSYENDGNVVVETARKLREREHSVFVFFGDQHTSIKEREWEIRCKNYAIDYTTLDSVFEEYELRKADDKDIDWAWLEEFCKSNLITKNYRQLMLTDPMLTRENHSRKPYYKNLNGNQINILVEIILKKIIKIFDLYKPDLIVVYERNYFVKNAFAQIALSKNVDIMSYISSRIGDYGYWIKNFGFKMDHIICDKVQHSHNKKIKEIIKDYINGDTRGLYQANALRIRHGEKSKAGIFKKYFHDEINSYRKIYKHIKSELRGKNKRWSTPLAGIFWKVRYFKLNCLIREINHAISNRYDSFDVKDSYILFPMHVLPESSTLTLGPEYYEIDIIRRISMYLPVNYYLYVKENPSMLSYRRNYEVNQIKEIANVKYISPYEDTRSLIENCNGVAAISGTALLEAALLGKAGLALGKPEFAHYLSHSGLNLIEDFIKFVTDGYQSDKIEKKIEKYIDNIQPYLIKATAKTLIQDLRTKNSSTIFDEVVESLISF